MPVRRLLVALLCLFISGQQLHAQPGSGNKEMTESADPGDKNKTQNTKEKPVTPGQKENAAPPAEKKGWAIRIKQGEKWYQLSIDFVMP